MEKLHIKVWDGTTTIPITLSDSRARCKDTLFSMREDHTRYGNPTPYKVSLSNDMYELLNKMYEEKKPIHEL